MLIQLVLLGFFALLPGLAALLATAAELRRQAVADAHASALQPVANQLLVGTLITLGLVVALTVAAAWVGGHYLIVRRIQRLLTATRRLRAGDLTARSGLSHGTGEMGQLAQAFDAMTSNRPYRNGLALEVAVAEIERCAGTQFDPQVAAAFLRAVRAGAITPAVEVRALVGAAS
ncbi:MAG TPA: HAMP domain-containing protein [Chloroflexota bacterium]|jgi:methyl-accepting chemotaxis protein